MATEHLEYWRISSIPYIKPPDTWPRVAVPETKAFSLDRCRAWCNDPLHPGEWSWMPMIGENRTVFAFSEERVAFAFKMRWV